LRGRGQDPLRRHALPQGHRPKGVEVKGETGRKSDVGRRTGMIVFSRILNSVSALRVVSKPESAVSQVGSLPLSSDVRRPTSDLAGWLLSLPLFLLTLVPGTASANLPVPSDTTSLRDIRGTAMAS